MCVISKLSVKSCHPLVLIPRGGEHVLNMVAKSPFEDLLPIACGSISLSEDIIEYVTLVASKKGNEKQLSDTLKVAHGMALPAPNRITGRVEARCVWFGQQYLLMGPKPDQSLNKVARLTNVSDGYAVARLQGTESERVLARLVPINVSRNVFKRGQTARTLIQHMHGSLTRVSDTSFQIIVLRSMALNLVHDIERAMQSIAARDHL